MAASSLNWRDFYPLGGAERVLAIFPRITQTKQARIAGFPGREKISNVDRLVNINSDRNVSVMRQGRGVKWTGETVMAFGHRSETGLSTDLLFVCVNPRSQVRWN